LKTWRETRAAETDASRFSSKIWCLDQIGNLFAVWRWRAPSWQRPTIAVLLPSVPLLHKGKKYCQRRPRSLSAGSPSQRRPSSADVHTTSDQPVAPTEMKSKAATWQLAAWIEPCGHLLDRSPSGPSGPSGEGCFVVGCSLLRAPACETARVREDLAGSEPGGIGRVIVGSRSSWSSTYRWSL
jgi:hypothetical protein